MNNRTKLVNNTISHQEIDNLCAWLKTYPKLTKGEHTETFESKWSDWLGCKYSVFVNSGSSANLAMAYSAKLSGILKNDIVIAPCLSWATTVSPFIQLGFDIKLCDASKNDLGLDTNMLEDLCKKYNPSILILAHILGFPNDMQDIVDICNKYGIMLLEDTCESVGSYYESKKLGTFGDMSSFSTYFGHHFSTIEGGLISTNNFKLYEILKSIRSHGWSRDLSIETQDELKSKYDIDEFNNLYTFYYPGFNIRSTDLQAFLGIEQLKTLDKKNIIRYNNLLMYDKLINNNYWKIQFSNFISNFAYPVIHPNKKMISLKLQENNIECRPLVCGNIAKQPYFYDRYGKQEYSFADIIHEYGLYVPNNPELSNEDIVKISYIINEYSC
jgi:CDP-6-deoxy-D-xylo-4-hexulose-3-dehydrase